MLIEHLNDLVHCGFVSKTKSNGYPLSVAYTLTIPRGQTILEALKIMQQIGIQYITEHNMGKGYFARIEKRRSLGKKIQLDPNSLKNPD